MKVRLRKGYKKHLQRRIKEKNLKKHIKHEYYYITRINNSSLLCRYGGTDCTFNGYYVDDRGTIKQINKYSKRYWFKNPRHRRRIRRHHFNNVEDTNITSIGRNYKKINSKKSLKNHETMSEIISDEYIT